MVINNQYLKFIRRKRNEEKCIIIFIIIYISIYKRIETLTIGSKFYYQNINQFFF